MHTAQCIVNVANVRFGFIVSILTNYNRVGGKRIYLNWKIANFPLILSGDDVLIDMIYVYLTRFSVLCIRWTVYVFIWGNEIGLLVEIATVFDHLAKCIAKRWTRNQWTSKTDSVTIQWKQTYACDVKEQRDRNQN